MTLLGTLRGALHCVADYVGQGPRIEPKVKNAVACVVFIRDVNTHGKKRKYSFFA